jgi:hypothetical protein
MSSQTQPLGAIIPRLLLPRPGIDLYRWAVIACDQFTSEPEYWEEVARLIGDAPSTYHMILPEVLLGTPREEPRIASIRAAMDDYLREKIFIEREGLVLVERAVDGKTRRGLMLALDLEHYDYGKDAASLIRATEGTILERLPPRVRIRSGAPLEVPHILVLLDDPDKTVIEPLAAASSEEETLYDFDLMMDSGHLRGQLIGEPQQVERAISALCALADPEAFACKYNLPPGSPVMLFAMGDGNHSLATAKSIWEQHKLELGMDHPARYALVEVENIHDAGLTFEPIHRVAFDVREDLTTALDAYFGGRCQLTPSASEAEMMALVDGQPGPAHLIGVISPDGFAVAAVSSPASNLPVGTLQGFLDDWGERGGYARIDYVHGADVAARLGVQPGNVGFYLPAVPKSSFFKTVIADGALPRKAFSMGEAREKRFYMEARRIEPV